MSNHYVPRKMGHFDRQIVASKTARRYVISPELSVEQDMAILVMSLETVASEFTLTGPSGLSYTARGDFTNCYQGGVYAHR